MNATRQTNTFIAGMNMDVDYSLLKENQYKYAENIRILTNEGTSMGAMQNIEGFYQCTPTIGLENETIIHVATIRDWAIVITYLESSTSVSNAYFSIYRYDFGSVSQETVPTVTKVVDSKQLGFKQRVNGTWPISSVLRWESDDNVKIYLADGSSQIKVINVDDDHIEYNDTITADLVTILPKAVLPPFEYNGMGSGNLSSGKIQYCYQLFNTRGLETALSQLSPLIHLASKDSQTDYNDVVGDASNQATGKSVKLKVYNENTTYERAKIISIYYASKNDTPTITVIDDIDVSGSSYIYYEDRGGSTVSELTVDELNALAGYMFIPQVIESKDNILFAANVQEETWDVDYDARAYRANVNGTVLLLSNSESSIAFSLNDVYTTDIDETYDCISPFNVGSDTNYRYTYDSSGSLVLGGKGKNISYQFVYANLVEDDSSYSSGLYDETFTFSATSTAITNLPVYDENSTQVGAVGMTSTKQQFNYSSPEVDAKLCGYKRGEIYRFGIVFYNSRNVASPVHWIADIKFPNNASTFTYFTTGKDTSEYGDDIAVITHPLGIQFTVNNIPSDVVRWEIVRCERTLSDRTKLAQGVVSCVTNYQTSTSSATSSNILLPFPYLAYSDEHGYTAGNYDYSYSFDLASTQSEDYFIFVSPEIAVNRDNSDELINKIQTLTCVGALTSPIATNATYWGVNSSAYSGKVLANAMAIKDGNGVILETSSGNSLPYNGFVESSKIIMNTEKFSGSSISSDSDYSYCALLAKYFSFSASALTGTATVDAIKYAAPADPWTADSQWPWYNADGVTIGDKTYYNWVWDNVQQVSEGDTDKTDANNVRKYGPHGVCAVFKSSGLTSQVSLLDTTLTYRYLNGVMLCDMEQSVTPYGGNSYSNIQNSTYISTNATGSASDSSVICFGGDTYINIFDYNNCMFAFKQDDYEEDTMNRCFCGAFIPVESSINLALTQDESSIHRSYVAGTGYANHFVQDDIVTIGSLYTQSTPSYAYNDAYSAQSTALTFSAKSIYNIDNLVSDTRIYASEVKTNNEVTDSWAEFKTANYLDLDTRFGGITDMTLFQNRLLVWQEDAFGTVSVNERALISDNNPGALTLGTGDILDRYDYFTTKNGKSETQLRADTQSDAAVYWYDYDRNEICGFDNALQTVSKLKGVQSFLNVTKDDFVVNTPTTNALWDPIAVYDKKYNEVLFTLSDNVLVFNEQIGAFTSFYTYRPDFYAEFSDKLYLFKDLTLYKYNGGEDADLDDSTAKVAYMQYVVNENYPQTKTFDNVEYGGDFTYGTNFNEIYFETKRQTSYTLDDEDIDYREDTYKFCIPRNSIELDAAQELVNKSYKDRMKGKYLVCNYKYDCNGGNVFKVPYISTAYRNSLI